jgi:hypothetical protein
MVKCRGTLIAEVAALGLAIAFTSPVSVVTVIILLSMSSGLRRTLVFGLTSITTIAAPVVVAVIAPERSAETLAKWRLWLIGNSRTIVPVLLMVIGAILIARGTYSLTT